MPAGGRGQGPRVGFSSLPIPPQPRHHQGVYVAAGMGEAAAGGTTGELTLQGPSSRSTFLSNISCKAKQSKDKITRKGKPLAAEP